MDTRRIVIDIDGMPTAIIPRGENQSPIILYTLPPPPYYKHADFELIEAGPPPPPPVYVDDDGGFDPFWCKFITLTILVILVVTGTCLIMLNW